MSRQFPRSTLSRTHSGFAMIDPETELFHHKRGRAQHVAISYVWSEWQQSTGSGGLPDWPLLRARLRELVGPGASSFMRVTTGHRLNCWLDSKCIDQASAADKAYWIPQMDEVYSEARCTVLLLRGVDLGVLAEAEQRLACDIDDDTHSCLLAQSCTALTDLSGLPELEMVAVVRQLWDGTWRRRAWIFQEILLSDEYILSGENNTQLRLSDIGVLAGLLFRRLPEKGFWNKFSDWCRRLLWLRRRYFNYNLCAASILQMAQGLEAAVPADKYYALCGILRLESLSYNRDHTAHEALQAVCFELTRKGALSWLYAIRPAMQVPPNSQMIDVRESSLSAYVDIHQELSGSFYAKPRVTPRSVSFDVNVLGTVRKVLSIADVLSQTEHMLQGNPQVVAIPDELAYLANIPILLLKMALDSTLPLLQGTLAALLNRVLGLGVDASAADMVWRLYTLEDGPDRPPSDQRSQDLPTKELAMSASWALNRRIAALEQDYRVILWSRDETTSSSQPRDSSDLKDCAMALGLAHVVEAAGVCRVRGDQILIAASLGGGTGAEMAARWAGALISLRGEDIKLGLLDRLAAKMRRKPAGEGRPVQLDFALEGEQEVSYQQVINGSFSEDSSGWQKVVRCCRIAKARGLDWAWIDTCCIDNTSSAELSETINSMFAWYEASSECYVFIDGIPTTSLPALDSMADEDRWMQGLAPAEIQNIFAFTENHWFKRGWTLQELLAPSSVTFFNETNDVLGDRAQLAALTSHATSIDIGHLKQETDFHDASVAQRMGWASQPLTTRPEDMAYSLLGLFGVNMPLLYGEGGEKAFRRLQLEVLKLSADESLFAWGLRSPLGKLTGMLAASGRDFAGSERVASVPIYSGVQTRFVTVDRGIAIQSRDWRNIFSRFVGLWDGLGTGLAGQDPEPRRNIFSRFVGLWVTLDFRACWARPRASPLEHHLVLRKTAGRG
ncbi:Uu.00g030370.m01.CDS01 [Anthostomella pinea]|uniref:Uu.00g030370.m01.CDS01 n=1 Tax=Anthostomella pinea TaxID=933095 RepID=A0AAI8V851_9PEZI|nr:Uu.00g030370.m01.CDS01 [Anthostomella pinea]